MDSVKPLSDNTVVSEYVSYSVDMYDVYHQEDPIRFEPRVNLKTKQPSTT